MSEGYSILRPLGDGRTLLARDASGRQVVLKPLPGDCLLGRQLHPSVRLRLQRIRELADAGVANCHGLVRMPDGDFLVWEHVAGQSIDESSPDPAWLARELPLAVRTLHVRGLVHGALHGRNVLIDGSGRLRLTHLSPLLYDDPAVDERAVEQLLQARRGARDAEAPATVARVRSTDPMRRRAAIAAVAVTVGAVGLAWWVVRVAHRAATTDPVPPPTRAGDWVAQ